LPGSQQRAVGYKNYHFEINGLFKIAQIEKLTTQAIAVSVLVKLKL
jgi:hypothetical protein